MKGGRRIRLELFIERKKWEQDKPFTGLIKSKLQWKRFMAIIRWLIQIKVMHLESE